MAFRPIYVGIKYYLLLAICTHTHQELLINPIAQVWAAKEVCITCVACRV